MNQLLNAALGYSAPQGAPPKPETKQGTGDVSQHLANASAAHKAGDHHKAKKHALKAVNMLHRMSQAPGGAATVPDSAGGVSAPTPGGV